ncbi:hypothetical protein P691DRAFT_758326 [Macrolepiota fuliginosa MF-IS2]|uniref:Nephrocystin 3-like N-terminal domain-containing protein n=1 Tax=Macrolepiota fuliginosa MF-IS2 TaxID=1400762 RepID=A0A9P5XF57_9AGAR|nr:hypothetical protein P691DRAFT_758326 [Macrolepiota fuliginosa MF-IS2]
MPAGPVSRFLDEAQGCNTQAHESAHLYVPLSSSLYSRGREVANPRTIVPSTPHHETASNGCLEDLVTTEPISTMYPPLNDVQWAQRLPKHPESAILPELAKSAEIGAPMTSNFTPSLNILPQGHTSGQSSQYHPMRQSKCEHPLVPQGAQSEPFEQPRQLLPNNMAYLDWQQERPNFSMVPSDSSRHQQDPGVESQPPSHHGDMHENRTDWSGHSGWTLTPNSNIDSSFSGNRTKRKYGSCIPHEVLGSSKRPHIAHVDTLLNGRRFPTAGRGQPTSSDPSKEINPALSGPIQPAIQPRTQTPVGDLRGEGGGSLTTTEPSGGFLQAARGVVLHQPNMVDGTQNIYFQADQFQRGVLPWLAEYTMRGAGFDSSDRDPPPRCHPGTRATIINGIHSWLENPQRERKLLWLRGLAGVGKSAIVQTFAEKLSEQRRLGASLFFSRTNGRTDPRRVLPTLAYQFAIQDPSYKAYITELKLKDPQFLDKTMGDLFRLLIGEPFGRNIITTKAWVVTLDGLDECGGDYVTLRHSDDTQREIVRLVSEFILQYPSTRLIWVIASRPETHLKAIFSEDAVKHSFWEQDVPVNSPEACQDVEKFLHDKFTDIWHRYPDHISATPWPAHNQFLQITLAASGLFVFAQVIIRFVEDSVVRNPVAQLRCVISIISKVPLSQLQRNPLAVLDALYGEILLKIPHDLLKAAKDLIASLIFLTRKDVDVYDISLSRICNFLSIARDDAVTVLSHLHSVLYFPTTHDIGKTRPCFYHASFQDFLEDPSRSREYSIDIRESGSALFWGSQGLIKAMWRSGSDSLSWPGNGDDDCSEWLTHFTIRRMRDINQCLWRGSSWGGGLLVSLYSIKVPVSDSIFLNSIFESVNYQLLLKEQFSHIGGVLYDFTYSPTRKAELDDLQRRQIVTYTTLQSLGIDKARLTSSRLDGGLDMVLIALDEPAGIQGNLEDIDPLLHFIELAPPIKVAIWGRKGSECCTIIETRRHGVSDTSEFSRTFIIIGF